MECEALVCPVCGAPYRKVIPAGIVHVRCIYCGGTIVVPSSAPRCPNHPDSLAFSLCNDCSQRYCPDCLSNYALKGEVSGILHLCSKCLTQRYLTNMLMGYTKSYGVVNASARLKNRLKSYMRSGLSREEAIRKMAEDEGYT